MPDTARQAGALAEDWAHWQRLGFTSDLLPVVSDRSVAISEHSKMQALGKTPSMINRHGKAVGIPEWTQKHTTDGEIGRWAMDQRLGICIQCRVLRAIDIDIKDRAVVEQVVALIFIITGELPMRYRNDSGKCLLLFYMPGEFVKRIIHTAHGAIEFLANGQQFVAVGRHPDGERYQWKGGLPERVPELTAAEFGSLWAMLQDEYGIEPERIARGGLARPSVPRSPNATVDDVTNFLEANGWVRSWTKDGRVNIDCPFKDEHTSDSGDTETQYLPRGVGGFANGHFKCMHAHCAGRIDSDFLDAIKFMDGEFEDLTALVPGADGVAVPAQAVALDGTSAPVGLPPPRYMRTRGGEVLATISNLVMALERADQCGMRIAWDAFKDEIVWASPGESMDWRPFRDHDYVQLRIRLIKPLSEGGANFKDIGRELIRDAVHFVAMHNQIDSAVVWAESLQWDGVERVEQFFHTYFRTANNPYTRAVGLYLWTGLAGRALVPGIKADMAVILKSEQGTVKTEGIKSMSPHPDMFGELDLTKGDDVLARQTRGKLVCEISELKGLNSRDHGAIKSWVSRTHEEWVPKFKEFATKFPRRFLCIGTTNEDEFLGDATGERRWLPMEVGRTDIERLRADCEQLWAEGVHLFKTGGIQWQEAERLARYEHSRFKVQDGWHDMTLAWLNDESFGDFPGIRQGDFPLRIEQVLQAAVGLRAQELDRRAQLRMGNILRCNGYKPATVRLHGVSTRVWVNDERLAAAQELREAANALG